MSDQKTLSTVFKAVDQFTPVATKIGDAGKSASKDVKQLQNTINKGVTATAFEKTAGSIADYFDKAEKEVSSDMKEMGSAVENGLRKAAEESEAAGTEVGKFAVEAEKASEKAKGFGKYTSKAGKEVRNFGDDANEASNEVTKMGESAESAGNLVKGFITAIGLGVAIKEIKDYATAAEETFTTFEKGTAEVKTLLAGSTQAELDAIDSEVKNFALNNAMLTSEVTPALYSAISAGVDKNDAFDFLSSANKLSVGGVAELNDAVGVMTTIVNNYKKQGLEATEASDLLFTTVKKGVTTIPELAHSLGEVVPSASASGVAFKDVTAAMATLTASLGTGSTATATTKFRSMLDELSTTGSEVDKTFRSINKGKSFNDFIASGGTLQEALVKLNEQATKDNVSIKELFSSVEAGGAALVLGSTAAETFTQNMIEMENAAGATDEAYATMQDTTNYLNNQLASKIEGMQLTVGEKMANATEPLKRTILENMPLIEDVVDNFFTIVESGIESIDADLSGILNGINGSLQWVAKNGGTIKTALSGIIGVVIAEKTISGVSNFAKGLTNILAGGPTLPLTLTAGAISAVVVGLHEYSEWAKEESLEEHFGNITLSLSEMEKMADTVVTGGNLGKIRASLEEFEKLDGIKDSIDDTASNLDKLNWKVGIGFTLTEDENESYKASIDSYISGVEDYVEQQHYSATVAINLLFGEDDKTGSSIIENFDKFYNDKQTELQAAGKKLRDAVNDAYKDGLLTFDEAEKIEEIRAQIAQIEASIAADKLNSGLEGAKTDFSYKDITPESAKEYAETINNTVKESVDAYAEARNIAVASATTDEEKAQINNKYLENKGSAIAKGSSTVNSTIYETYADALKAGNAYWNKLDLTDTFVSAIEMSNNIGVSEGFGVLMQEMSTQYTEFAKAFENGMSSGDRSAISELYEQMKPQHKELLEMGQSYIEAGKTIPGGIRAGILDNAKVGAALDDQSSLYTLIAYNATRQNPEYANAVLKAKQSGEEIPDEMLLGIELAKPGAISAAETTSQEVVEGAVEKIEEGAPNVKSAAVSSGKATGEGYKEGLTSVFPEIFSKAVQFTNTIKSALGVTASVTKEDGTVSSFAIEVKKGEVPIEFNALGGIYDRPTLTWIAEAGDAEAIIPLNDTQRAYDLWQEAGQAIGAARGYTGTAFTGTAFTDTTYSITSTNITTAEKTIVIKLEGGGEIKIPKTLSKQDIINILSDNVKPILIDIINQEMFEEGDGVYET